MICLTQQHSILVSMFKETKVGTEISLIIRKHKYDQDNIKKQTNSNSRKKNILK